jgi:enamine deaminase RidA (YjgF/YER057c/UK114 family)
MSLEMTTITPLRTGMAAHIGTYADAVAVSDGGTQICVSGTPGLREDGTPPENFTDEAGQYWANVENALGKAVAKLTDIVYMRQWLTCCDNESAYLTVGKAIIHHQPAAAMLSIIDGLVWPNVCAEVEVTAILPGHERFERQDQRPPCRHRRRRHRRGPGRASVLGALKDPVAHEEGRPWS